MFLWLLSRLWNTSWFFTASMDPETNVVRATPSVATSEEKLPASPKSICWWAVDERRDKDAKTLVDKKSLSEIRCLDGDLWRATCAASRINSPRYELYLHRHGYASCSCPDFIYRSGACKHLRALRIIIEFLRLAGHELVSSFYYPGSPEAAQAYCSTIPSNYEMDVVATVNVAAETLVLVTLFPNGTPPFPRRLPEFVGCSHRINENLFNFLLGRNSDETGQGSLFRHEIQPILDKLTTLDLFPGMAQFQEARKQLLEISERMKLSAHPSLPEAVEKDEQYICEALHEVVVSAEAMESAIAAHAQDQLVVDFIFMLVHNWQRQFQDYGKGLHSGASRFLVKLTAASGIMPPESVIHGVTRDRDEDSLEKAGGFANVFSGRYKGKKVALKQLRIYGIPSASKAKEAFNAFCKEAIVWGQLDHPNVLPFLGVEADTPPTNYYCMVLPWMDNGTILDHVERHGVIDIDKRIVEIAEGLRYLHSKNVVHGDLRGSNILIGPDWEVRLADFGLAVFSDGRVGDTVSFRIGSTPWHAPELIRPDIFGLERFTRTTRSDIFAFACVCFEVHYSRPPFVEDRIGIRMLRGERPDRPANNARCQIDDRLWMLMSRCWSQEREDRPNASAVVDIMRAWPQTEQ